MFNKTREFIKKHKNGIALTGLGIVALSVMRNVIKSDIDKAFDSHGVEVCINTKDVDRMLFAQVNRGEEA